MNAQTKHSSGPWVAVELHDADQPWAIIPSRQPIAASVANKTLDIAAIWPRGGKKMAEANARLIAAAPELLEALQDIASSCAIVAALETCRERDVLLGVEKLARAAIAKATGEQP